MCIEDWKFGRFIRTEAKNINVTTSATEILGSDPSRVFVRFSVNTSTSISLFLDDTADSSRFLTFEDRSPQEVLHMYKDGDVTTRRIYANSGSGTVRIFMLVGYLPERVLQMTLEEMKELGVG